MMRRLLQHHSADFGGRFMLFQYFSSEKVTNPVTGKRLCVFRTGGTLGLGASARREEIRAKTSMASASLIPPADGKKPSKAGAQPISRVRAQPD
jgi:hypothetical protein